MVSKKYMGLTQYALGFCFPDPGRQQVIVISKNRPHELKGLWNAPGGRLESNETAAKAVSREVEEEIGISISYKFWTPVALLERSSLRIHIFAAVNSDFYNFKTITDEIVDIRDVATLGEKECAPYFLVMLGAAMRAFGPFSL